MGLPGSVAIRIRTEFSEEERSVTRKLEYRGGSGLNSLSACSLGEEKHWFPNSAIFADTIEFPDGDHWIHKRHVGPGQYDFKWCEGKGDEVGLEEWVGNGGD